MERKPKRNRKMQTRFSKFENFPNKVLNYDNDLIHLTLLANCALISFEQAI